MADEVRWDADGDGPAVSDERDARCEWIDLDVPADSWWEIVDHPEVVDRGLDGWTFSACAPSPLGDHRVVLTYFRPLTRPVTHTRRPTRRGRRVERGSCGRD